jgi:hypothetical protein
MPRYFGGVADAAPLIIQVQAGATTTAVCFAVEVEGQSVAGNASRPILYRPSIVGTLSGTAPTPEVRGKTPFLTPSSCNLITNFASPPSLPTVTTGAFALPIRVSWMTDTSDGVVFQNSGALVLYQSCTLGYTTTGAMSWEEL